MPLRTDRHAARLSAEVSIERLAVQVGVKLRGRGGPCPFHLGEKNPPNLSIDRKANTWRCPSCASEGAGVIEFVAQAEGISRRHAIAKLKSGEPLTGAALHRRGGRGQGLVKTTTVRDLDDAFAVEGDAELLANVVGFYHRTLLDAPEALTWVQKRGLRSSEMVETFKLGYANRTLGLRLPQANRKSGKELRERLQRLGIIRASGHEHFNGCVVVPVFGENGEVIQIYGRKIRDDLRAGTALHLYLHDDRRGVFNLAGLKGSKTVILTEGVLDALTYIVHGHHNVTCCFGTQLTPEVRQALTEHEVERVLLAFDRDVEGEAGAKKLAKELADAGMEVLRVVFPKGMDANGFSRQADDPTEALGRIVRHAEWMAGRGKLNAPTTPRPSVPSEPMSTEATDDIVLEFGDRRWRVRGLSSNTAIGTMRLNLMVSREHVGFHVDVFDLYSSRHRAAFTRLASEELSLDENEIKRDLGHILLSAELAQDELLLQRQHAPVTATPEMTEDDRAVALALLKDPKLLDKVAEDLDRCGLVGERTNKLILYLAVTSRLLDDPLAVVVQSSSAAGKSSLMDAVLGFVPEEHRREFSAMTGQALFYVAPGELRHRVLAIAEEEGAHRASYPLKILQSEKRLVIASTSKDPNTGRLVAKEYVVEGPVALVMTTTSLDIDPELENRCVVLAVDESPEQTKAIHERQRQALTLDGIVARGERDRLRKLHQDAQRLLVPLLVVVPEDAEVSFHGHGVRARRDHRKLLGLVRAVTLLHQHQREVQVHLDDEGHELRYLVATEDDIAVAQSLFSEAHGNGLADVPPQTRRLLDFLAINEGPFTRRDLREHTGWSDTTLRRHLRRLVELEMLVVHRAGRGGTCVYDVAEGSETAKSPGSEAKFAYPKRNFAGGRRGGATQDDVANSETEGAPAPPERGVAKPGRQKARTGKKAKTRRTSRSPGRRKGK